MSKPTPNNHKRIYRTVCDCTREIIINLPNTPDSNKERWIRCEDCKSINRAMEIDK